MNTATPTVRTPELCIKTIRSLNQITAYSVVDEAVGRGELVVVRNSESEAIQAVNELTFNPYHVALLRLKSAAHFNQPVQLVDCFGKGREYALRDGATFKLFGSCMRQPLYFKARFDDEGYHITMLDPSGEVECEFTTALASSVIHNLSS